MKKGLLIGALIGFVTAIFLFYLLNQWFMSDFSRETITSVNHYVGIKASSSQSFIDCMNQKSKEIDKFGPYNISNPRPVLTSDDECRSSKEKMYWDIEQSISKAKLNRYGLRALGFFPIAVFYAFFIALGAIFGWIIELILRKKKR